MATDLLLNVKKDDYVGLIEKLEGKMQELTSTLESYQKLKQDVNNFVKDSDSNFTNMQERVEANIDGVRRGIGLTQKAKDSLQRTVDQMDDMSTNVSNLMKEGTELAGNAIKTAIRIDGLGL